jgi:hypothetical protein
VSRFSFFPSLVIVSPASVATHSDDTRVFSVSLASVQLGPGNEEIPTLFDHSPAPIRRVLTGATDWA